MNEATLRSELLAIVNSIRDYEDGPSNSEAVDQIIDVADQYYGDY